ncbi:MAG: DEAD/DEAH box helicase [Mediterranea sp.]|jgi:superfamily II DNA or RNA helicase|nr:DEAD/DEAH box helicase [Mediterranea sp.]
MTSEQKEFYNTLSGNNKIIIQVAMFCGSDVRIRDIARLISPYIKIFIAQSNIKSVIQKAVDKGLFRAEKYDSDTFTASLEPFIEIYPTLGKYQQLWTKLWDTTYHSKLPNMKPKTLMWHVRDVLHGLCHSSGKNGEYAAAEQHFVADCPEDIERVYSLIVQNENYLKRLGQISPAILRLACGHSLTTRMNMLRPFGEMDAFINLLSKGIKSEDMLSDEVAFVRNAQRIWAGLFDQKSPRSSYSFCDEEMVRELLRGNPDNAWEIASRHIKKTNIAESIKCPFYIRDLDAYYGMLALLLMDEKKSKPAFGTLMAWEAKNSKYASYNAPFNALVYDHSSEQREKAEQYARMARNSVMNEQGAPLRQICNALICYIVDKPIHKEEEAYTKLMDLYSTAIQGEAFLMAYELAYALNEWYHTPQTKREYDALRKRFDFTPLVSRVERQSEWEKRLNQLLKLDTDQKASTEEGATRIAYYFNPMDYSALQPILQVRQAKKWSKGRAIGLSTFYNRAVEGMSDLDQRVAQCMKEEKASSSWYYGSAVNYSFTIDALRELVGSPAVYLADSKNIPVELAGGIPTVSVEDTGKGYRLSSNIAINAEKIPEVLVQKETNTRYVIFTLTPTQREIVHILSNESLLIPQQGKEKLTALLSVFSSAGMNIHSDLVDGSAENIDLKEVPTDSRIRIQLLPYGDGLKAELFSKPFGTLPPYCKPGKGGKALIANEGEERLQVKRDLEQERKNEQALMDDIQALESLDINDGLMSFGDPLDSLHLLDIALRHTDKCVVEWPEGERLKLRGTARTRNLNMRISSGIGWFDLSGELRINEETVVSLQQLLELTSQGHRQFIELSPGEFITLSKELKKQLDTIRLLATNEKGHIRLNIFASASLKDLFDQMENLVADKRWKDFRERVSASADTVANLPANLHAELRPYQEEGFRWMARLSEWGAGACLSDEMGLGKTLQSLAVLLHRADKGPALVICPVSLIGNWTAEAGRFAPSLKVKTLSYAGNGRKEVIDSLRSGDLLVTSYGLLQSESELLTETRFATILLDEAHVIKNTTTKTSKATMELKGDFRIALTGTPIQNHLGEIWNLFNFINPGLLGDLQHFNDIFVKAPDEQSRKYLKKLISPFILRRTKSAVMDELPPKTEIVKRIALSSEEMAFYEALRRQALTNLSNEENGPGHLQVLAEITRLRQACCNPSLVDPRTTIASTKLATLLTLVDELRENGHRALVFSQFVTHLTIVRKALDEQGVKYQYLDGAVSAKERKQRVDAFQAGDGELFLISLKAGGLGLNLTAADYVIHLDPWWNPAIEDQASDRAHRFGQTRPVTIYRLVAEDTIEEKILQLHHYKRDMAESLLEGSDMAAKLSIQEIMELIR